MESRRVDTEGEGEGGTSGEKSLETYTSPSAGQPASGVCWATQGVQTRVLGQPRGVAGGGGEVQEGGDLCISMADSC